MDGWFIAVAIYFGLQLIADAIIKCFGKEKQDGE